VEHHCAYNSLAMATGTTIKVLVKDGGETLISPRPRPVVPNSGNWTAVETAAILASKTPSLPAVPTTPMLTSYGSNPLSHFRPNPETRQQHTNRRPSMGAPSNCGSSTSKPSLSASLSASQSLATSQQQTKAGGAASKKSTKNCSDTGDMTLRSGKWAPEEERYANILIELFEEGLVDEFEIRNNENHQQNNDNDNDNDEEDETTQQQRQQKQQRQQPPFKIANGMTMRAYLSRKLFCSPMRISKKFAGKGIGKLVYMSQSNGMFYNHKQPFQIGPAPISSPHAAFPQPSSVDWNRWNRLRQAELNFLRLAFPYGDPRKSKTKKRCPTPTSTTKSFAASSAAAKQNTTASRVEEIPSFTGTPRKVQHPIGASSSTVHFEMQAAPLAANNQTPIGARPKFVDPIPQPSSELQHDGQYPPQPVWDQKQLVHHNHHERIQGPSEMKTGETSRARSATRSGSFPFCSPSQETRMGSYPPLSPYPNPQPKQSNTIHNQIAGCCYSIHQNAAVVSAHNSFKSSQNHHHQQQRLTSPLMPAPQVPNTRRVVSTPTNWILENCQRKELTNAPQLQQLLPKPKRQREQKQKQSQVQVLQQAYYTSISPSKQRVSKHVGANTATMRASPQQPSKAVYSSAPRQSFEVNEELSTNQMQNMWQNNNNQTTNSAEAQSKSAKDTTRNAQPATINITPDFDWCQLKRGSPKPEISLPNFLSGFDKVAKQKATATFDHSIPPNSASYMLQSPEFSPAYHTSKSFDDFHRFLGKGLSPTLSPPPKFPKFNTKSAGPAIPPIESSDDPPKSILQMRMRNPKNDRTSSMLQMRRLSPKKGAPAIISDERTSSKSGSLILKKKNNGSMLSQAYEEVLRGSNNQQSLQPAQAQGKCLFKTSEHCNVSTNKPGIATAQYSECAFEEETREQPIQSCSTQPIGVLDYPVDGMTFEDFDTLGSYPDPTADPMATYSDKHAAASDPSEGREGSNLGARGVISDDSENT